MTCNCRRTVCSLCISGIGFLVQVPIAVDEVKQDVLVVIDVSVDQGSILGLSNLRSIGLDQKDSVRSIPVGTTGMGQKPAIH